MNKHWKDIDELFTQDREKNPFLFALHNQDREFLIHNFDEIQSEY